MRRLGIVIGMIAVVLVLVGCYVELAANRIVGAAPRPLSPQAARVHAASFVVDLHADSLLWWRDLAERSWVGHVDLPRMRVGNVGLQVFTVVSRFPATANISSTDPQMPDLITLLAVTNFWPPSTYRSLTERVLYQARKLEALAERDAKLVLIRKRADLERLVRERAKDTGFVGALLGIEGAHALDRPTALDEVAAAGVRMIGLAHFFDNRYAGSAHGLEKGVLTPAARELVAEMEKRHIIVDLAHSSAKTIDDVLAIAKKPVVVSHTGVKGTCDNERNLSDDQLKRIAAGGGVIGIGYWPTAVCGESVADIARAIAHAAKVAGDEHVALGSDFDGAVTTPIDTAQLADVTQALFDAGLAEDSIQRILGENVLRVLRLLLPGP